MAPTCSTRRYNIGYNKVCQDMSSVAGDHLSRSGPPIMGH